MLSEKIRSYLERLEVVLGFFPGSHRLELRPSRSNRYVLELSLSPESLEVLSSELGAQLLRRPSPAPISELRVFNNPPYPEELTVISRPLPLDFRPYPLVFSVFHQLGRELSTTLTYPLTGSGPKILEADLIFREGRRALMEPLVDQERYLEALGATLGHLEFLRTTSGFRRGEYPAVRLVSYEELSAYLFVPGLVL